MAAEKPKRKRVKVKTGQLAAAPLLDGTFALVHVALYNGMVIAAHFAHRATTPEQLHEGLELALRSGPIAMLEITSDEIYDGLWPVVGQREPAYPPEMLDMKGRSYGAASSRAFFEAYYGLRPWDGLFDPRYYEKQLLPGVPVPPTVRYKKDFEGDAAVRANKPKAVPASEAESESTVKEGPGEIHIEIKYDGEGLPSIPLLKRRQSIETALESAGVGEITDAGGGGGVMDIYLQTADVARALEVAHTAIEEAGFKASTRVEVSPLDEDAAGEDLEDATEDDETP